MKRLILFCLAAFAALSLTAACVSIEDVAEPAPTQRPAATAAPERSVDDILQSADSHAGRGDYAQAVSEYTELLRVLEDLDASPEDFANTYTLRGLAHFGLEDYQRAIADYDRAAELYPTFADIYIARAQAYSGLGDEAAMLADFERARAAGFDIEEFLAGMEEFEDTAPIAGLTVQIEDGGLELTDEDWQTLTGSVSETSAALMQAIIAVNSFVFVDPAETSYQEFQRRAAEAGLALEVLSIAAESGESLYGQLEALAMQRLPLGTLVANPPPRALSSGEVLAIVKTASTGRQLRTLMSTLNVNAKRAKLILDNAMAGIQSDVWSNEAEVNDKCLRAAVAIKETSALTLTVAGTVMTAGTATAPLAFGEQFVMAVSNADAIIKTAKAGYELVVGKDVEGWDKNLFARGISGMGEVIAIKNLFSPGHVLDWASNITYLVGKTNDALQEQKINIGDESISIAPLADPKPPATPAGPLLPKGKYVVRTEQGNKKVDSPGVPEWLAKQVAKPLPPEAVLAPIKEAAAAPPDAEVAGPPEEPQAPADSDRVAGDAIPGIYVARLLGGQDFDSIGEEMVLNPCGYSFDGKYVYDLDTVFWTEVVVGEQEVAAWDGVGTETQVFTARVVIVFDGVYYPEDNTVSGVVEGRRIDFYDEELDTEEYTPFDGTFDGRWDGNRFTGTWQADLGEGLKGTWSTEQFLEELPCR